MQMSIDEEITLWESRQYVVTKSNDIVQKSRYELSVPEQKTIAYICSMIKPRTARDRAIQTDFILEYEFSIRDYCKVCGIDYNSGKNYNDVKELLKGLVSKIMWLTLEDGTETTVNWVSKVWCNKGSGKCKVRLDEDMVPYLFDLQERFVSYGLYSILGMKSQYSIRIYELLKSYAYQKTKVFEIEELKKKLMVSEIKSYERFPDFRRKVLEIALKEINELTDLWVDLVPITKGRKVIKVQFDIRKKEAEEHQITMNHVGIMLEKSDRKRRKVKDKISI